MTRAELRTELTRLLAYDLDNKAGDTPSVADLNQQIDDAIRVISRKVFLVRNDITLTLPNGSWKVNLQTITPTPVQVLRIYRSGVPFKDFTGRPGLYTQPEFAADYPAAESGLVTGVPTAACQLDQWLIFNRKVAADTEFKLTAQVESAPLTADGQEPDLPEWLHPALAYFAASEAAAPQVETEAGYMRIRDYTERAMSRLAVEEAQNRAEWGMGSETKKEEEQAS